MGAKMKAIGIDPGTMSFDFFGMDGDRIILDASVPTSEVPQHPEVLLDTIRDILPVDIIVGPSGYGLPVTNIKDATDRELSLMIPLDESVPVNEGIRRVIELMKSEGLPVYFTPGVIHLPTIPSYRKANKMDMGTADKLCSVALAMKDEAEYWGIDYNETSFIFVEVGYGFNAIIGVLAGKVVDGIGGTSGGPGFLSLGAMDSELAIRTGKLPQIAVFSGGVKDVFGKDDFTPEQMVKEQHRYSDACDMLLESIAKGVAAMTISVPSPRELLLSGRLTRISEMLDLLKGKLSQFGEVRLVRRQAKIAKEAAEGTYIIGEGLLGGKYKGIVDSLQLKKAQGTMFDHIYLKGLP
jgi:predicted butyrate kinase (DUF1464 family)